MNLSTKTPYSFVWVVVTWAFVSLSSACRNDATTPEETLRTFLSNLGNPRASDELWAALSAKSKAEIERRATELAEAVGEAPTKDPARLLFEVADLVPLRSYESISISSPLGGQELTLRVSVKDGAGTSIKMVREGSRWKIDLFSALKPTATSTKS